MTMRYSPAPMMGLLLAGMMTLPAGASPLAVAASDVAPSHTIRVDYRPYYHCHGPKRCHGKGNYYKYSPSQSYEPFKYGCRYGCGYNNGWNSPSSRFDYIGRRYGKYRRHRH